MVICVQRADGWLRIPTYWPQSEEWNFVLKQMEAAAIAANTAELTHSDSGSQKLDLEEHLKGITTVPGLESFTMTDTAKEKIDSIADWGPESYKHLESVGCISGYMMDKLPGDEALFQNWKEFCACYARECVDHQRGQVESARETTAALAVDPAGGS